MRDNYSAYKNEISINTHLYIPIQGPVHCIFLFSMQKVISFSLLASVVLCKPPLTWRASTRLIYTATLTLRNRFVELWPYRKQEHGFILYVSSSDYSFGRNCMSESMPLCCTTDKDYTSIYTVCPFNREKEKPSLNMVITSVLLSLNNICHLHLYSMWWWWIFMIIINKGLN